MKNRILLAALCALTLTATVASSADKKPAAPAVNNNGAALKTAVTDPIPVIRTGPLVFAWNANDPSEHVTEYRLVIDGAAPVATTALSYRVDAGLPVGQHSVSVAAYNGMESDPATLTFQVISKPLPVSGLNVTVAAP